MGWRLGLQPLFTAIVPLALGITACGQHGPAEIADPGRVSQLHKGSSTKTDVQALFGTPQGTQYAENGDQTWNYYYTAAVQGVTAEAFGVKPFSFLSVTFDKNGIVSSFSMNGS